MAENNIYFTVSVSQGPGCGLAGDFGSRFFNEVSLKLLVGTEVSSKGSAGVGDPLPSSLMWC